MQYQFHLSKESEHILENESLVKEYFLLKCTFPSCFFSNCVYYSTHHILISNISNLVINNISSFTN